MILDVFNQFAPSTLTTYVPAFREAPIDIKPEADGRSITSTCLPVRSDIVTRTTSRDLSTVILKVDVKGFGYNNTWLSADSCTCALSVATDFRPCPTALIVQNCT